MLWQAFWVVVACSAFTWIAVGVAVLSTKAREWADENAEWNRQ